MAAKVRISDIVDALQTQSEWLWAYVNVETGKVETVLKQDICDVENGLYDDEEEEDSADDEDGEWKLLKEITFGDKWERLPSQHDLHHWSIMENFAESVTSPRIRSDLHRALNRRGAYGNFRDAVKRYHLTEAWEAFRKEALRE